MNVHEAEHRYHTLVVTVENKSGVLARVASLFARRAFNIESLAVAPTDDEDMSRITVVVDLESAPLDQIVKQLDKLVNVVEIRELAPGQAVERELMLVTVTAEPDRRDEIVEHLDRAGGKVLSLGTDRMMLSLVGPPRRVDEFEDLLREYGIIELQRTGRVALPVLDDALD
ncbi:MAG: acetolactate synthase small subunit [Acidimicrobiaceae bacterium]|jgi:acetolactate synthase-1/3 small subunit|nr:acetolactate synthase small subunit [Acidimicrobiaceae bacterium]MBT6372752.1 acetolactate synthase small subunit [Acidimicrobiaceae bacterium]MDG1464305.1 acetolactate synthase small subunit [Acidimicrobiales bacterium]|tara:strand:- start:47 stop:559 length:513 start_codon:yes stop_codon:yes gene_type:complete